MFKTKRQKRAIKLMQRGLLTTRTRFNNHQRLALWHWKLGALKNSEQQEQAA